MRKLLPPYLYLIIALIVGASLFAVPHAADASAAGSVAGTVLNWVTGGTDFVYGIFGKILWFVTVPISGWLVWLAGLMIDGVILISSNPDFYDSAAIDSAWGILRDVANMLFIFVLIYHGLQVILGINGVSTKKTIANVVIAAVFINFSLFATKVVIDVSNITAAWFIQGVQNVGGEESISGSVRAILQMSRLAQSSMGGGAVDLSNLSAQAFATGIAVTVLNIIAAYVFFQVFFLLLGRLVTFMILLITSPIGFVGALLDPLKEYAEKWRKELLAQAMMAPIFFLLLYVTLFIVGEMDDKMFGQDIAQFDPVTGTSFSPMNYIMFAVIVMLLLKILDLTKEYSGEMGSKIGGFIKTGLTFAGGAVAMGTIGKAASSLAGNERMQAWAAKSGVGALALKGVKATAGAGFGVASAYKDLGIADKIPFGKNAFKGAEKGYEGKIAQEKKDEAEFAKLLGKGLKGAENRKVYAERLRGGLVDKVRQTSGGTGAGIGAAVGLATAGPVGAAVGAAVGGYAGKKAASAFDAAGKVVGAIADSKAGKMVGAAGAAIGKVPYLGATVTAGAGILGKVFNDKAAEDAKKDIKEGAEKEYATEAGKLAEDAIKSFKLKSESDLEMIRILKAERDLNSEVNRSLDGLNDAQKQEVTKAKAAYNKAIKDMEELRKAEASVKQSIEKADAKTFTINGVKVSAEKFAEEKAKLDDNLLKVRDEIRSLESNPETPSTATAKWDIDRKKKARENELVRDHVEALEKARIKLKTRDMDGIREVADEAKKKKAEERSEQFKKLIDESGKDSGGGDKK